jgi:hypothetical protein
VGVEVAANRKRARLEPRGLFVASSQRRSEEASNAVGVRECDDAAGVVRELIESGSRRRRARASQQRCGIRSPAR